MKRILFVCSQNKLRSPTAERVFSTRKDVVVKSAGIHKDARAVLTGEQVLWADMIFVMERFHRNKIRKKFANELEGKRLVCLNIPDDYDFMDPLLVEILERKVALHLQ